MNKLEARKAKIYPNKSNRFYYKYTHALKPVVSISCYSGNDSFTLTEVNNKYFVVENNTDKIILINYVISKSNTQSLKKAETLIDIYINSTGDEIINVVQDENGFYNQFSYDFFGMFEYPEGEQVTYSIEDFTSPVDPDTALLYKDIVFIGEEGILDLNPDFYSSLVTVEVSVRATIEDVFAISKKTINFIEYTTNPLYVATEDYNINYASPSSLDAALTKNIIYTSTPSDTISAFFIPDSYSQSSNTYFVFSPDLNNNISMDLVLLSNDTVYFTSTPDSPSEGSSIPSLYDGYTNYNFRIKTENNIKYYFWLDYNTNTWYYNNDRFPNLN